jgi:hypothetical protein
MLALRSLAIPLMLAATGAAAQVHGVNVQKFRSYLQTSATDVALAGGACGGTCPFGFQALVMGQNIGGITPPVLSGPIASGVLPASFWNNGRLQFFAEAGWHLGDAMGWGSPTQEDLDAKFGNGTYTLTVNGESISLPLTGDAYPNVPMAILSGGTWSGGVHVFDATQELRLTSNAFTAYGTHPDDVIFLSSNTLGYTQQNASTVSANTATRVFPANSFTNGNDYFLLVGFTRIVSSVGVPNGSYRSSNYNALTGLTIRARAGGVTTPTPTPTPVPQAVTSITIGKQVHYTQTSANDVAIDPIPYEFFANVKGPGDISPPPRVSGPIEWTRLAEFYSPDGTMRYNGIRHRWEVYARYSSEQSLTRTFANGPYTLRVNGRDVHLNLGGDIYPDVPKLSFGRDNGRWENGTYVFDPTRPLTIYSGNYAGYGSHLEDRVRINFDSTGAEVAQYHSAVPGINSISYTLAANSLKPDDRTTVRSQFALATELFPDAYPGSLNGTLYSSTTLVNLLAEAPPQIFPLTVNANIGATTSSATAIVQPRPEDVGKVASIYVFAVAPATIVKNAAVEKGAQLAMVARDRQKDATAVPCVLAQLTASGELKAVSTANLQAYVTGVLTGQSRAVTIIDNVPTVNIGGAVFYLGMGADPQSMLKEGINQRGTSVPGSIACDPKPPQTGWWWNRTEAGRGYSIEYAGNKLVFASYLYDATGRSTWFLAAGGASLDGALFTGHELETYSNGQTLGGPYRAPNGAFAGPVTLTFQDAAHGTMIWPGGTVAIERFEIVPSGLSMAAQANEPQSGWWWSPSESGRGFFLEWQGGQLFMAGYMYDDAGNPIWYLSGNSAPSTNLQSYSNTWQLYGNGQTLTGAYRAPTQVSGNVAPVTIQFSGAETGLMTLPGGRTAAIRRFRF